MSIVFIELDVRKQLNYTNPCDCGDHDSPDEIPGNISLSVSALHSLDGDRSLLGNFRKTVHSSVDDMAIEPRDALGDHTEDELMGDELIDFIPIESVVGSRPETGPEILDLCWETVFLSTDVELMLLLECQLTVGA